MKSINKLRNDLNDIMFNNFIVSEKSPQYLFHYTDIDAAKSIIQTGQFWVSDAFVTNDTKEIVHIKNAIDEIITTKYSSINFEKMVICIDLFDHVCNLIKENVFILCFSLSNDSKKMWINYSKRGNKTGVCLRFNFQDITPNPLHDLLTQDRYFVDQNENDNRIQVKNLNHQVTYDKSLVMEKIGEYLDLIFQVLEPISINESNFESYKNEFNLMSDIFTDMFLFSCFSKLSSFEYENEYRMLYVFPDSSVYPSILKTRFYKYKEIRYVRTNMKSNNTFSLDRVYIENSNFNKSKSEIKKCLKQTGMLGIKIKEHKVD